MKHGYYSATHAAQSGSVYWRRPDGAEVEVTAVDRPGAYLWPDAVARGEVVEYVRPGRPKPQSAGNYGPLCSHNRPNGHNCGLCAKQREAQVGWILSDAQRMIERARPEPEEG